MSTRRPPNRSDRSVTPTGAGAWRGIVVVVVAAGLGLLLLGKALDGPSSAEIATGDGGAAIGGGTDPDTSTPVVDPAATTAVPPTAPPTTATAAIDPAVKVIVANGSGVGGVAARYSEQLGAAGALVGTPTNLAEGQPRQAGSTVYYVNPESEPTARYLAAALSNTTVAVPVASLPSADLIENSDLQGAGVVVVIGQDLGGG